MSMDPIKTKAIIQKDYVDYLSSLLSVRNDDITGKASEAVKCGNFVKGPFLEATPPFKPGKSLNELHEEGTLSGEFKKIAGSIHYDRSLYIHQEQAIRKIREENKNIVVATGTGSGKSECYFIPIFDALMRQAESGALKPGVQALLLFPMNALANDQLKKLRQILAGYPQITFGRYTGETTFDAEETARRNYEQKYNQKPLVNELLSREKMQKTPPHILLTNYAMLEYLLLRPADSVFFDGEMAENWRFLVIDEAHTYKGANGTEIALLIRRLKERIYHNTGRKLQCIATSATLGNEDAKNDLAQFASQLFGEPFEASGIITSQRIRRSSLQDMRPFSPADYARLKSETESMSESEKSPAVYRELIWDSRIVDIQRFLEEQPQIFEDVADRIFADLQNVHERRKNLTQLIGLATIAKPDQDSTALLPARYHLFVKSLEGMFISFYPEVRVYLDRKEYINSAGKRIGVFELANCQRCGQEYIVGKTTPDGHLVQMSDRNQERPEYYLLVKQAPENEIEVDDDSFDEADVSGLEQFVLCTSCGKIVPAGESESQCCDISDDGKFIKVYRLKYSGKHGDINTCAMCGSVSTSIIKRFLTANHAATFAVSNSLYGLIPPKPIETAINDDDFFGADIGSVNEEYSKESGRKLLIFSDNRQEAAFFAGYMNNKYNQLMWRRLIIKELKKFPEGLRVDDLMSCIISVADKSGLFNRNSVDALSDVQKRILASKYVMYEFLRHDKTTGLEGRGYIDILPESLRTGSKWELEPSEVWNLLRAMMDTLRIAGASVYPDQVNAKDEFFAPSNREVYFRREKRDRSAGREILSFLPDEGRKNKRLKYLIKLCTVLGITEDERARRAKQMLEEIYGLLAQQLANRGYFLSENMGAAGTAFAINYKKWYIRYIPEEDTLYRCEKCGKIVSYHVKGICPELKCTGNLKGVTAKDYRDDPYYSAQYSNNQIIPMEAKEHTAQLTKEAAGDYQREFEEGRINVLSCSTTFEMGVDVGELEAIFLRNVPPETSNYIQRAGRAGRRTSSTAFSVTFARRNSHDINYFNHPEDIINGRIAPPYIENNNEKIAVRHINSVIMAWFFKKHQSYFTEGAKAIIGDGNSESAADLLRKELNEYPSEIIDALRKVLPTELFKRMGIAEWSFIDRLIGEDGALTNAIAVRKDEISQLRSSLAKLVDQMKLGPAKSIQYLINTYTEEKVLNFLATNGVVPKYGFPVDVVPLNILNNSQDAKKIDLSRDLKVAVAEFAPPGSVVANGKVWTSRYINTIPDRGWPAYRYYECPACKHISPPESVTVIDQDAEVEEKPCPGCTSLMRAKKFVIPIFGFSTAMEEKPVPVGDSRPQHGYATKVQFWGIGELDSYQKEQRKEASYYSDGRIMKAEYSPNGKLVILNRGVNGAGLWICKTCGCVKAFPTEPKHKNKFGHDCVNTHLSNSALGHTFSTDILRIELPYHIGSFNSNNSDVRLSVLYAIIDGASDALGISRNDINGCVDYDNGKPAIILFDEAAGGAGHVKKAFEQMEQVLLAALKRVNGDCGCSEETSCYGCLRNYQNQYEHERLTRGGAKEYMSWLLAAENECSDSESA